MQESVCVPRPTSPIHIHVDDLTPVHVHVRKQKKTKPSSGKADHGQQMEKLSRMDKSTMAMEGSAPPAPPPLNSGARHVTSRPRSRSPQHLGPWVPPPAKSTKGSKYAWMGPTQRPDGLSSPLKKGEGDGEGELDTEDEERVLSKMRQYERTIDELMKEVGSLKNEAALQKSQKEVEKKDDILNASVKLLESKEQELNELKNLEKNPAKYEGR